MDTPTLQTARLVLRAWRPEDLDPFAALNQDPEVMRYFPALLSREESDALAHSSIQGLEARGWGRWAVERPGIAAFIGCIGLSVPTWEAHFSPCVEIVWRLAKDSWGQGLAPEGARAVLAFAFERIGLAAVVSCTSLLNRPSIRVMEKVGMLRNPEDDFDHPKVPDGHPLRKHVLYRLRNPGAGRGGQVSSQT